MLITQQIKFGIIVERRINTLQLETTVASHEEDNRVNEFDDQDKEEATKAMNEVDIMEEFSSIKKVWIRGLTTRTTRMQMGRIL